MNKSLTHSLLFFYLKTFKLQRLMDIRKKKLAVITKG